MLHARRVKVLKGDYAISADGAPLTTWTSRTWRTGGTFELDGCRYEVAASFTGSKYAMTDADGQVVAAADHVGRKQWALSAGGVRYDFARRSIGGRDQELLQDGVVVGGVRRVAAARSDVEADLPTLPLAVQLFVLVVVLTMWEAEDVVAAASS